MAGGSVVGGADPGVGLGLEAGEGAGAAGGPGPGEARQEEWKEQQVEQEILGRLGS